MLEVARSRNLLSGFVTTLKRLFESVMGTLFCLLLYVKYAEMCIKVVWVAKEWVWLSIHSISPPQPRILYENLLAKKFCYIISMNPILIEGNGGLEVAAFNIQVFGKTKSGKEEVMRVLSKVRMTYHDTEEAGI